MTDTPAPSPAPKKPRRRYLRWAFDIVLVIAVILAINAWRTRDVQPGPLPDFHAELASGEVTSLEAWRAQHAGHAVAVYFWAEWCPICKTIEGSINGVADNWPVLSVAMQSGNALEVSAELEERGLDWPTMIDEHGQLAARLGVRGVPMVFILDADGHTRFTEIGFSTQTGLRLRLWWANTVPRRAS